MAGRGPPRRDRPLPPYATAVAEGLPDARLVVDHFHVIRLANAALDEVRRRVQHTTTGHRGRKDDPLYRIRRRLLTGHERLGPAGFARVLAYLDAGDPHGEVGAAYAAKELLRESFAAADVFDERRGLVAFYEYCATSDVIELARLARTIARWEIPILPWHRTRLTNAATEGTNLVIKNIKRLGFGFRSFDNYRLRLLLRCGAPRQHRHVTSLTDVPARGTTAPTVRKGGPPRDGGPLGPDPRAGVGAPSEGSRLCPSGRPYGPAGEVGTT